MIIIGELINASRKSVKAAIETQNREDILKLATDQADAGANYIDVNAGVFIDDEPEHLKWLVENVQTAVQVPCAIDSPAPKAIEAALASHQGIPMINSISLEKERYDNLIPIIRGTDFKVIALCMSDEGMPQTVDDRLRIADKLVNGLIQADVPVENIYVDPLVQPLSVNDTFGMEFINAIEKIKAAFKGIHTACGLSNISYGLPARQMLNHTFMSMAIAKGLDGAIVNPLDRKMMAAIITAEALAGKDEYCSRYLEAYRASLFD